MESSADSKETWISVHKLSHSTPPVHFNNVMENLLKNPNITSSLLFRAEIFYDSTTDASATWNSQSDDETSEEEAFKSDFTKHMKVDLRPRGLGKNHSLWLQQLHSTVPSFPVNEKSEGSRIKRWQWKWQRTVVRNLVPRNPQRDRPCAQSCWYFQSVDADDQKMATNEQVTTGAQDDDISSSEVVRGEQRDLVIYIPHVSSKEDIPFYHPACRGLAMLHTYTPPPNETPSSQDGHGTAARDPPTGQGTLEVFYSLFSDADLSNRLSRTALNIGTTIAKHCAGQAAGYTKRVHHDQIVPQKNMQDTYTRLKETYAKPIIEKWVEATDPSKHVFEDLGIAAFLIELWKDMYQRDKTKFPGFVDIGCGNGLLVYILLSEGYEGWGFDIRKRKTWDALPQDVVAGRLREKTCVPHVLTAALDEQQQHPLGSSEEADPNVFDGSLPGGTFIISNHADELTAWTPLLAYMSSCPFIAIPCCSHDLGGNRFRAKPPPPPSEQLPPPQPAPPNRPSESESNEKRAAGKGQLKKHNPSAPSAYASLCSWLEKLSQDVGFTPEREVLRIPSTRNVAVLGRKRKLPCDTIATVEDAEARSQEVASLIEREMGKSLQTVAAEWIQRSSKIALSKGGGH